MDRTQLDALVAAAAEGVDRDWLTVRHGDGGYDLSVPGADYGGLPEGSLREVLADHGTYVEEWCFWARTVPEAPDHEAFLRWIERADGRSVADRREELRDGVERTWGQLRVHAELAGDGGQLVPRTLSPRETVRGR